MLSRVWLAVFLLALFAVGCTDAPNDVDASALDFEVKEDTKTAVPTPPPSVNEWTPPRPDNPQSVNQIAPFTPEDNVRLSDIVARVRLIEVGERIFTLTPQQYNRWETSFNFQAAETGFVPDANIYVPMIAFNFEVLEYLRGGKSAAKIWALTLLEYGSSKTESEARAALTYYSDKRDKRWDDREAIVFLREVGNSADWMPDSHYYIGVFMGSGYSVETYSLDAYRQWYPASDDNGGASSSSGEQQLFLVSPGDVTSARASTGSTIRLSELRQLASLSDADLHNRFLEVAKDNMSEWLTARELKAMETRDEIILRWEGISVRTQASGYRILRRSEGGADFTVLGDVSTNLMGIYEYKDTEKVESSVEYTYIVRAVTDELHNGVDAQVSLATSGVRTTATPTSTPTPTWTPTATATPTATPTITPAILLPTATPLPPARTSDCPSTTPLIVPTPTPFVISGHEPYPDRAPSIDEHIIRVAAIVRVRPPHISISAKTLPGAPCVAPTYRPVVEFAFDVVEYLKGSGVSKIRVEDPAKHTYLTRQEALDAANREFRRRNTTWDSPEAVIFLEDLAKSGQASDANGDFTQTYHFESNGYPYDSPYSFDSSNKVWLPATGPFDANSSGQADTTFLVDPEPIKGVTKPVEYTIQQLRDRIASVEAMLAKGKDIEGYEECIRRKLAHKTLLRGYREAEGKPYTPRTVDFGTSQSGLPSDTELDKSSIHGTGYTKRWFTGPDAALLHLALSDGEKTFVPNYVATRNQYTFYYVSYRVSRPLPAGKYTTYSNFQRPEWIPCNFTTPPSTWIFTFESPPGAIHEAFFDPVSIGAGFGANAINGVLKPASFISAVGDATTIDRISWQDGQVHMRLSPHATLADKHIDFLALDASIALRLDFDDATVTTVAAGHKELAWRVCKQPWTAGDLLMLRISESPDELAGVTNNVGCLSATQ